MFSFLKRAFQAWADSAGRYPVPLVWTF